MEAARRRSGSPAIYLGHRIQMRSYGEGREADSGESAFNDLGHTMEDRTAESISGDVDATSRRESGAGYRVKNAPFHRLPFSLLMV